MNDNNMNDRTLHEIVTTSPEAADVLVRHGLDFCCRGQRTLGEACREAGLDPAQVAAELAAAGADAPAPQSWRTRPLAELVDHIVDRYHRALRQDLPALLELARRVETVHADKPTRPAGLAAHLEQVWAAVASHLDKEERILFPLIRTGRGAMAHMPIRVMMQEHEDHGENLRRTRELTGGLIAPPEACEAWRKLYDGLLRLESELMQHIHLENYVLFPRALEVRGLE